MPRKTSKKMNICLRRARCTSVFIFLPPFASPCFNLFQSQMRSMWVTTRSPALGKDAPEPPILEGLQVWYNQHLHGFWVRWNKAQRLCMFSDIHRRLLLGDLVHQVLVLTLQQRLLPVKIL